MTGLASTDALRRQKEAAIGGHTLGVARFGVRCAAGERDSGERDSGERDSGEGDRCCDSR
jgi:hypothetical protein